MKKVSITKLDNKAVVPTRGSTGAAGYDLYTTEFHVLKPGERKLFKTGLSHVLFLLECMAELLHAVDWPTKKA
jgi:dUTPase